MAPSPQSAMGAASKPDFLYDADQAARLVCKILAHVSNQGRIYFATVESLQQPVVIEMSIGGKVHSASLYSPSGLFTPADIRAAAIAVLRSAGFQRTEIAQASYFPLPAPIPVQ